MASLEPRPSTQFFLQPWQKKNCVEGLGSRLANGGLVKCLSRGHCQATVAGISCFYEAIETGEKNGAH